MIDLESRTEGLALVIAPEIPDQFDVPEQNGVTAVPVESWHRSLANGFRNGPGKFFAAGDTSSGLRLVLLEARLDYVPTAMLARGARVGAAAVVARVRYMARLATATGEVIGRAQGEVYSTQPWMEMGGSSTTGSEAIEAMYVDLTKKLLRSPAPASIVK